MIKKNIKKCALFCLIAVLVCSVCVVLTQPLNDVKGGTVSFDIANVSDTNRVGTEITLDTEITAMYKGSEVTFTNGSITYPNGKKYGVGTHKLNDVGTYLVEYYYKDGNVIVTAEKKFAITNDYYALSSAAGSITAVLGSDNVEGKELITNADDVLLNNRDGLILRLEDGCQFIYNTPIDLSKSNEDGIAEIINLNYRMGDLVKNDNPDEWFDFMHDNGVLNPNFYYKYAGDTADRCKIRLTDAYNPDIYIELDSQVGELTTNTSNVLYKNNYRAPCSAAAVGQTLHGCHPSSTPSDYGDIVEINGTNYIAYRNWNRATDPTCWLTKGPKNSGGTLWQGNTWGYDIEKNIVYVKGSGGWNVVNDLDHPGIYPDNAFPGFTTGEVYVSIYFTDYAGAGDARVDIYGIGGKSGAELVDMNGKGGRVDFAAPEITINYEETDNGIIYAPYNSEVEIPTAFVKELFYDGTYNVNAYTNYGTQNSKLVTIKNNKIKLDEFTKYTIEYSVTDNSGQKGVSTMVICPSLVEKAIWVETEKLTSVEAGDTVKLPEYLIKTINKEESIKYSIKVVGEKETINIDPAYNTFIPQYTGKYKVIFEFEDNVYSDVFEYEINVVASNSVKFVNKPVLPKYVISGEKYFFEELKGYVYSQNAVKTVVGDAYISEDGAEFKKINTANGYTISATESIKLKYVKDGVESQVAEAKVISNKNDDGIVRLYKYFVGDYTVVDEFNAAGRPITANITYDLNQRNGTDTLTFANILDINSFLFQFKPGENVNYSTISFILTDVNDERIKKEIKIYLKSSGYIIAVDGTELFVGSSYANAAATYTVEYKSASRKMVVNGYSFNCDFSNFLSNSVYFDIEFGGINGEVSFTVEKVGNHVFRGTKVKDDTVPTVSVIPKDGSYEIGDKILLTAPNYYDVISQIDRSKTKATIDHEDGTSIVLDNPFEDYELVLDKIGMYTISYDTYDSTGLRGRYRYSVRVVDNTAPVLTINGYAEDSMIVLKNLTVYKLDYTVTDDISAVENVWVSVRLENLATGEIIKPKSNTEIELTQEGDFAVYVVAIDEAGNLTSKTIYIRVEGGK